MGNVFSGIGDWAKKGFFVLTALAIAGLNLLMLMDVFQSNILFVILGMIFFSVATWVYMVTAFAANDKTSGAQSILAWIGMILSLIGELSMAVFEILRVQSFIAPPVWIDTVTIIVIEVAIIFHLLLGIAYFASSADYNEKLNRLHEDSKRRKSDEKLREERAKAEIKIQEDATKQGVVLTKSMLDAALPIVAEQKARLIAMEIARTFGLDANPELNHAFEIAIRTYRAGQQTAALQPGAGETTVLITPPPASRVVEPTYTPVDPATLNPTTPAKGRK